MKKYVLLILSTIISSTTFSQASLSPTLHLQDKDTLFCFTIPQSKFIAQKISSEMYCDSITKEQDKTIESFTELDKLNTGRIHLLKEKNKNLTSIVENQDQIISGLKSDKKALKNEVKKQKIYKWLSFVGMITLGIVHAL